jgi:ribonucleoside-diphosphate reductase alpha chain
MKVIKRSGTPQSVSFDKISTRIGRLAKGLDIDPIVIAKTTIASLCDGITTSHLDRIAAEHAEALGFLHPDYSILAARLAISDNQKNTPSSFTTACREQRAKGWLTDPATYDYMIRNGDALDAIIVHERDYLFTYSGFMTLANQGYLKTDEELPTQGTAQRGNVIDRPQYMYLRMAIAKWYNTPNHLEEIRADYEYTSLQLLSHGTPHMQNACESGQLASCFLLGCPDDTHGIGEFTTKLMEISKSGGGIGAYMHDVRPAGSRIKSSRGVSSGICPQLEIHEKVALTFDQGGGKRKGSFAFYLELWHADIINFLQMRRKAGGAYRAEKLFYGIWANDLFYKRLAQNGKWSLMGADTAPGLSDVYDGMEVCTKCGHCDNPAYNKYVSPRAHNKCAACTFEEVDAFTILYTRYEVAGLARHVITCAEIDAVLNTTRRETGVPYVCNKDHVNRQTNQKNIGTIKSSNLCTEIMQWSSATSCASCILASVNLTRLVVGSTFDFDKLAAVTARAVKNCDRTVSVNNYPISDCIGNAEMTRAIAVGVQGMADVFALLRIPYDSDAATALATRIFETMYAAALMQSVELAKVHGPYPAFAGSPASRGLLRPDLWMKNKARMGRPYQSPYSGHIDFEPIRREVITHGMRNSLLIGLMPTQSTGVILDNCECFESFHSMAFVRNTLSGDKPQYNKYLIRECIARGIWTDKLRQELLAANGNPAATSLPDSLKALFKITMDISQRRLITNMDKYSAFIDQAASLNLVLKNNSPIYFRSAMLDAWELGLMTGSYYVRTTASTEALKIGVSKEVTPAAVPEVVPVVVTPAAGPVCRLGGGCDSCGA